MAFAFNSFRRQLSIKPWRKTGGDNDLPWDKNTEDKLRSDCLKVAHGNDMKIVVAGLTGEGKTLLLTSLNTALQGTPIVQHVGHELGGNVRSVTTKVTEIPIFIEEERIPLTFIDMPGITGNEDAACFAHFEAAIKGYLPYGKELVPIQEGIEDFDEREPDDLSKPCSLVIVLNSCQLKRLETMMESKTVKNLQKLVDISRKEDMALKVVLTHCDEKNNLLKDLDQVKYIFHNSSIKKCVEAARRILLDTPASNILPVINYANIAEATTSHNILLLYALNNILTCAKYKAQQRDARRAAVQDE